MVRSLSSDAHRRTWCVGPRSRGPGVEGRDSARGELEGPVSARHGAVPRSCPWVFTRRERLLDRVALSLGGCGIRDPCGQGPRRHPDHADRELRSSGLAGNKVVEIRRARVNKGSHFAVKLSRESWDFILAIGDDWTDEALFAALPASAFSIRVGIEASAARLNAEGVAAILDLLEALPATSR